MQKRPGPRTNLARVAEAAPIAGARPTRSIGRAVAAGMARAENPPFPCGGVRPNYRTGWDEWWDDCRDKPKCPNRRCPLRLLSAQRPGAEAAVRRRMGLARERQGGRSSTGCG